MALLGEQRGPAPGPGGEDGRTSADDPASAEAAGTMTLFEHLAELRNRVVISLLAIVVGAVVAWFFYGDSISFMKSAYCTYLKHHPGKNVIGCNLVITSPLEGFSTRLKISMYEGLIVAAPVILWELWRFITPGLHKHEKRYIAPFVAAAVVLFASGVATAMLVFPKALNWLINVAGPGVTTLFSPARYFSLYLAMCVVFGLVFMYPLVLIFLQIAGVVPSARWRKWRRPAIVVLAVVAAVITPSSDPFSFFALAIPLVILYELSIVVGRLLKK